MSLNVSAMTITTTPAGAYVNCGRANRQAPRLHSLDTQQEVRYWPDLDYIRRSVPVTSVARELGLRVRGSSGHCWRTEAHQHGDRSPSLYFTRKNRWRCAVCDSRTASNLDLIQAVRGCDLRAAVEWVVARWEVPQVARGKHVNRRRDSQAPRYRVGTTGLPFEDLVRTGLWATLSKSSQAAVITILVFTDPETGWAEISQRGLRRYAGLSFGGVAIALRELGRIKLLEVGRGAAAGPLRRSNRYRLNFQCPAFLELLGAVQQRHCSAVQFEKQQQQQRREGKRCQGAYTQGTSLSTQ